MTITLPTEELPADNAARIAIYDVFSEAALVDGVERYGLTEDDVFGRVIGRLRILVPRELHLLGERRYVKEKIDACLNGGTLKRVSGAAHLLTLTGTPPRIRYPDGTLREYVAGLEAARERLERDDATLRGSVFDLNSVVPSMAHSKESAGFRALVSSMREHGYLKQFPILRGSNGDIIDGRARVEAAATVGVPVVEMSERLPQRRDTPLHRVLLALDANWGRMSDDERNHVHEVVSAKVERRWASIEADLTLTREWRRANPRAYTPLFDVKKVRFRPNDAPNVQVTKDSTDRKVMLRSLLEAAGLSNYKIQDLRDYVVMESARTKFSANRKAIFVGMTEAIAGIEAMQRDRRRRKRKLDPEWNAIKRWLTEQTRQRDESDTGGDGAPPPVEAEAAQPV